MKIKLSLFISLILALCGFVAVQGQVIIQHSGANDPLTEGFSIHNPPGDVELGPVFGDQGLDAWSIRDDRISNTTAYRYQLLPEEEAILSNAAGLMFSANMRLMKPGAARLSFRTGKIGFAFEIHLNDNGDISFTNLQVPFYTLENGGVHYHEYALVYNSLDGMAALWIDGTLRVSDILGQDTTLPAEFMFGNVGRQSHTHWNEVTFAMIPEPATVALLTGVGSLFIVCGARWRQRKRYSGR